MSPKIRAARAADCARLTEIAIAAKRHWGYPADWIDSWRDELTFTRDKLASWDVFCALEGGEVLGVGALSCDGEAEVEGLWVWPAAMGRGIGRLLLRRLVAQARTRGMAQLRVVSDPNALGFYRRNGAHVVGSLPSTPAGRTLPLCYLDCSPP